MLLYLLSCQFKQNIIVISFFLKDYINSKGQTRDYQNMAVGMFKKVYKEMVKEMNLISLQEEPTQQQHALEVYVIIDLIFYVH